MFLNMLVKILDTGGPLAVFALDGLADPLLSDGPSCSVFLFELLCGVLGACLLLMLFLFEIK